MKKSEFEEVEFLKNLDSIQEYTEKKTDLIKSSYSQSVLNKKSSILFK